MLAPGEKGQSMFKLGKYMKADVVKVKTCETNKAAFIDLGEIRESFLSPSLSLSLCICLSLCPSPLSLSCPILDSSPVFTTITQVELLLS